MKHTSNKEIQPMKDKMLKKAEKYVRSNAVYYGNNQYRLDMKDWLYFVEGCINEVNLSSMQRMADEAENALDDIYDYGMSRDSMLDKFRENLASRLKAQQLMEREK